MTETLPHPAQALPYCQSRTKRLLDIIGSLVDMVLYAPVFLLTVLVVWLFEQVFVFFFQ